MGAMLFHVISLIVLNLGLWGSMNGIPTRSPTSPLSNLQVHIRDEQTGRPLPARVYLVNSAGIEVEDKSSSIGLRFVQTKGGGKGK
jgi:hypothetical protein